MVDRRLLSSKRRGARGRARRRRLLLEALEPRRVLATFNVDIFADENDGNVSPGDLALREAIILANSNNQNDTINLQVGTYLLTIRGAGENASATGDLDIDGDNGHSVTIRGQGAGSTIISGGGVGGLNDRVFNISNIAQVTMRDLSITGGNAAGANDGGGVLTLGSVILNNVIVSGNLAGRDGGGLYNEGAGASLLVQDSTISGNTAGRFGGGVLNTRSLTLTRTTVSGNTADDGAGVANFSPAFPGSLSIVETTISGNTADDSGGGVYNSDAGSSLAITNSTVSGNLADFGAGILNTNGATLGLASTTITANTALNRGGGVRATGGDVGVKNTIIAANLGNNPDIDQTTGGTFMSNGHNLIGNGSTASGFVNGVNGDLVGSSAVPLNPLVGPLQDNGGPTLTHGLASASPAVNAGDNVGAPATDQRGFTRPAGPDVDIGAYELAIDLGDAPDTPYPTLLVRSGASHAVGVPASPRLGTLRDTENDGQPDATATGDDLAVSDDEDGVIFPATIRAGQLDARVNVTVNAPATLDAWIDFHGDGSWDAVPDQIFTGTSLAPGINALTFQVPADARKGTTFARFRVTTAGTAAPRGFADNGEVEDHPVTISAPTGTGTVAPGPLLGIATSRDVALGDVDGDGDLDAFVANDTFQANQVWVNQGGAQGGVVGTFLDSGQSIGASTSQGVALGDVDSDGDLDAFVANGTMADRVYLNQGGMQGGTEGIYLTSGQALTLGDSRDVALGDLDGDGDLDAFVASVGANRTLANQGGAQGGTEGVYLPRQSLGSSFSNGVALGDLDGDGDLDAFLANTGANRVWINQGSAMGVFLDSGQTLGTFDSRSVALGDVDGDGDLDAFIANAAGQANRVWLNLGGAQGGTAGVFADSGQTLGSSDSRDAALGDFDGDGDLDVFIANASSQPNRVWLNQGGLQGGTPGVFLNNGQALGTANSNAVQLGDLDLDTDLDAFVANGSPNEIWRNEVVVPVPTYNFVAANFFDIEGNKTSSVATLTRSVVTSSSSSVDVVLTGVSALAGQDFVAGPVTVNFAPGDTSKPVPIQLLDDTLDENSETITLSLTNFTPDGEGGSVQPTATFTILDNDDPPTVTLSANPLTIAEAGGASTLTATLSAASGRTVTVNLGFSGTATGGGTDYTVSSSQITITAGNVNGFSTVTAVDDAIDDDSENVVVDITSVLNGSEDGTQQVVITIDDDDDPPPTTTTVSLVGTTLVVEDTDGGDTDDQLTLRVLGSNLSIEDPNNTFSTSIPGASGNGTNQVTVPLALFNSIFVDTLGGLDSLTLGLSITNPLAGTISFDGGDADDMLIVQGAGVALALANMTNVDRIDVRGSGDNTLAVDLGSVLNNVDSAADALVVLANAGDAVNFDSGWSIPSTFVTGGNFFRVINQGSANVHLSGPFDWQNPLNNLDVVPDGIVTPLDALVPINEINNPQYSDPATGGLFDAALLPVFPNRYYDARGDNFITPADVLRIINFLNSQVVGNPEGGGALPATSPDPSQFTAVFLPDHESPARPGATSLRDVATGSVSPRDQVFAELGAAGTDRRPRAALLDARLLQDPRFAAEFVELDHALSAWHAARPASALEEYLRAESFLDDL